MGGGANLGPDPEMRGGADLGPDPGMGGGADLGSDPGMGDEPLAPESGIPGCDSLAPALEPPAGKDFGPDPGTCNRAAEPDGERVSELTSWAMIATSLGSFQPSMPSFQT
jgi:hypothetical protein